jgi:bifunctional ADP-heptose synthase (sugar kinase/adenylyltransferase)
MREAAVLANIAASIVVGEVGTAPITLEKLLRAVEQHCTERKHSRT